MFDSRLHVGGALLLCASVIAMAWPSTVWPANEDDVHVYPAISAGDRAVIEGRVVERKKNGDVNATDRKRDNFRRSMDFMINKERKRYPVTVRLGEREWQLTTDREGYFRVEAEQLGNLPPGWHDIVARTAQGEGGSRLLIVPPENVYGLISDVDDTIQVTEVNSKRRMLANTFLRNATQRDVVPGVVHFYRELAQHNPQPDLAPIVYLSASPRQLHPLLESFLAHNEFPPGVLITKRVTDDRTSEPIADQVAYKTKRIEALLSALPHVRFTLIGDDGERDPEIYADIQRRFPGRVEAIWIRRANPDPTRARIEGQGVLDDELSRHVEQL